MHAIAYEYLPSKFRAALLLMFICQSIFFSTEFSSFNKVRLQRLKAYFGWFDSRYRYDRYYAEDKFSEQYYKDFFSKTIAWVGLSLRASSIKYIDFYSFSVKFEIFYSYLLSKLIFFLGDFSENSLSFWILRWIGD